MNLNQYQHRAQRTDRAPVRGQKRIGIELAVPLLGLAGEAGELLSEYKKNLRNSDSHQLFKERVAEELGDILWYVANVGSKFNLRLEEIAAGNLKKTQDRWGAGDTSPLVLDKAFPSTERFPRKFEAELAEVATKGKTKIRLWVNGKRIGDDLTDNAEDPDGYRFHDVFHLGYVATLGWSPVIRKLMGRKRRSRAIVDEVQDGGRATVIDEAIAALVFTYAKDNNWLKGVSDLDYRLLRTIKDLTARLEVSKRTLAEWQQAILTGFRVWHDVRRNGGGRIQVDLDARQMTYIGTSNRSITKPPRTSGRR
jgi:NTP pyrophosphatase (non-canonical NTP hydrolase)